MSFSFFNSFNGNSQRLGQNYSIVSPDINPPGLISSIGTDTSSVTFSFTAPRTGGTVAGYTAYVNGKPFSGTGGPSSYTINGLTPGGQYTINMVANIVSTSSTITTVTGVLNPTTISGCTAWWDGADPNGTGVLPANGASITTWADKSGNGYNATAGSAATYSLSSKSLTFSNNYYTSNHPANPTNETCFVVYNVSNTTGYMVMIGSARGGREVAVNDTYTSVGMGNSGIAWGAISTGVGTVGRSYLVTGQISNGSSSTYISVNGALTLVGPTTMGSSFTAGVTTGLGREFPNQALFYGNIMEVLFYNSVLSTANRQKVEGYLAWKWNIQTYLPVAHPHYSSAPAGSPTTVIITTPKNVLSNPSQPLVISTLAPFPTNIQLISATSTSLTFSFTAPTTGPTPTSYIPYINGSVGTGSGTPSSYTISGLSGSTSYSVALGATLTTGTAFVPSSISGCFLWLDASDNSTITYSSGININQWNDKSGNSRNFSGATTYTTMPNGKKAVYFNGSQNMYSPTLTFPANFTTFIVAYVSNAGLNSILRGSQDCYFITYGLNNLYGYGVGTGGGSWKTLFQSTGTINNLSILGGSYSSTNTEATGYLNGTLFGPSTAAYSTFTGELQMGGANWGQGLTGHVAEVLIYNSTLSNTDRQKVEGYLAWKWGTQSSLPITHPYYSESIGIVTTSSYQNPNPVSLTTAIGTPTTLTFISSTATTITFSFTAPSGTVTGYTPYVNGSVGVGSGTASSYTITGLSASTSYSVTISASGPTGTSGLSTALSASTGVPTLNTYLPMNNNLLNYASGTGVSYAATATGVTFSNAVTGPANLGTYFLYNNSLTNYVNLNKTITFPSGGMSISFWVYTPTQNQAGYNNIFWFGTGSARYTVFLYSATTTSGFNVVWSYTGFQVQSTPTYTNNQWHHIVWTTASNNINNGYVDGNLILANSAGSNYPNLVNTNNYFFIENGGANGAKAMSAYLGEFRIYSTVLNQSQVNTLYNNGNGNINPGI